MPRLILTFKTLQRVMAAEKILRFEKGFKCRVTPVPHGLSDTVCGMAVELLNDTEKTAALTALEAINLSPSAVHEII